MHFITQRKGNKTAFCLEDK